MASFGQRSLCLDKATARNVPRFADAGGRASPVFRFPQQSEDISRTSVSSLIYFRLVDGVTSLLSNAGDVFSRCQGPLPDLSLISSRSNPATLKRWRSGAFATGMNATTIMHTPASVSKLIAPKKRPEQREAAHEDAHDARQTDERLERPRKPIARIMPL